MTPDDAETDRVLGAFASLRPHDVQQRRADRLRTRCHTLLAASHGQHEPVASFRRMWFRRVIAPAAGCAWCVVYVVEIIRRAAAAYGF